MVEGEKLSAFFPRLGKVSADFFQGLEKLVIPFSNVWKTAFCAALLLGGAAVAGESRVVVTSQMELEFREGWLTRWKNKLTDEEIRFGSGAAIPEAATAAFVKSDDATALLTLANPGVWGLRVPLTQVAALHADAGRMNQRYVLIQAKTGGLLLQLDDPNLAGRATLERDDARRESKLTFRATMSDGTPARWLIKQYVGGANWGAQHRLDYVQRTQSITPPEKRPTAWIQNVVFAVTEPPWCQPVGVVGVGWKKSLDIHHDWLENLLRVVDADKVLFCTRNWGAEFGAASPYAALMSGRARRSGFHVMLRLLPVAKDPQRFESQRFENETFRHAKVGEILAAVRAMDADAVMLEGLPDSDPAAEREFFKQLRAEFDLNGMTAVAIAVAGEPSDAALPYVDLAGGGLTLRLLTRGGPVLDEQVAVTPSAIREALMRNTVFQAAFSLDALLLEENRQMFGLPPGGAPPFTRLQIGLFALARWWGENQPRLVEPKFFEPSDLARFRLNTERIVRLVAPEPNTLRLVYEPGEVVAELNANGWTNNAALLEQHGPVFLKDRTEK